MNQAPETLPSFRSRFLWFMAWGIAAAVVVLYIVPISGVLLSIPAAIVGMLAGVGMALLLMLRREARSIPPILWGIMVVGAIGLFLMLHTLLIQLPLLPLPAYFPSAWVFYPSAVGAGWLLGAGLPLLCHGVVSAGYRLLE